MLQMVEASSKRFLKKKVLKIKLILSRELMLQLWFSSIENSANSLAYE